jgi:cell division protein ZapA
MRDIRSTGKVIGLERVAIMAALNISHELLSLKNGGSPVESNEEQQRLSALNSQLDEVLYQLRQLEIN